jgi:hypothetical protein
LSIALIAVCAEALVIAIVMRLGWTLARIREARGPDRVLRERRELEQLLREIREGGHVRIPWSWDQGPAAATARARKCRESARLSGSACSFQPQAAAISFRRRPSHNPYV